MLYPPFLPALVFLAQLAVFLLIARYRLVDGDEGYYLMASRLVMEGKAPYHDFLLQQTPLGPYVYGIWMVLAGVKWRSARVLAGLLTALLGTSLYAYAARETSRRVAGLSAVILFVSSTLVFGWMPIVKTYSLSGLLLFLAFWSVDRGPVLCPKWAIAAGGLFLGLAADVRLFCAGLLPLFLWWVFRAADAGARRAALFCFLGGFGVAVSPNLYLLSLDPAAYVFGNIGYHAIRSGSGLIGDLGQKIETIRFLLLSRGDGNGYQVSMLVLLSIVGVAFTGDHDLAGARRALQIALALGLISLLPTPCFVQYFSVCMPFLIVSAVCSWSSIVDRMRTGPLKRTAVVCYLVGLPTFAAFSMTDYSRFLHSGKDVIGIVREDRALSWQVDSVVAVSHAIDELAEPGERVVSMWPGYLLESKAAPFPGLENNVATYLAGEITSEQRSKYHIASAGDIEAALKARDPRLFVLGNQESMLVEAAPYETMLARLNYTCVGTVGGATLWRAPR